jgi:hypothetical protein
MWFRECSAIIPHQFNILLRLYKKWNEQQLQITLVQFLLGTDSSRKGGITQRRKGRQHDAALISLNEKITANGFCEMLESIDWKPQLQINQGQL